MQSTSEVRRLISESGLTISATARHLGVHRRTVHRWIDQEVKPTGINALNFQALLASRGVIASMRQILSLEELYGPDDDGFDVLAAAMGQLAEPRLK